MQPLFSWLTILVLSPDLTKIFPFFGPPAVVGRFLENRVCLSFCPFFHQSGRFLEIGSRNLFEVVHYSRMF